MNLWKIVLAWGCLISFFGIPSIFFLIHLANLNAEPAWATRVGEFRYLADYLKTITAIIISLAGFNTVEVFKKYGRNDDQNGIGDRGRNRDPVARD
jgi:hypothetical protein